MSVQHQRKTNDSLDIEKNNIELSFNSINNQNLDNFQIKKKG